MQENDIQNPLIRHMRRPKIYIKLPSQGKYWPTGSINLTQNMEFPVFSMSARDELLLNTPDALLNGQAVVDVIQSCVPNIINAWETPSVDLDIILIGIRMATYGDKIETTVTLDDMEYTYEFDLRALLDRLYQKISWNNKLVIDDLEFFIKPLNYKNMSEASIETFEIQRILNLVNDDSMPEEKKKELFKENFDKLLNLRIQQIANSVYKIVSSGEEVTDPKFISEFIENCDSSIFDKIKDFIEKLVEDNKIRTITIPTTQEMKDKGMGETVEIPVEFDAANFFG